MSLIANLGRLLTEWAERHRDRLLFLANFGRLLMEWAERRRDRHEKHVIDLLRELGIR